MCSSVGGSVSGGGGGDVGLGIGGGVGDGIIGGGGDGIIGGGDVDVGIGVGVGDGIGSEYANSQPLFGIVPYQTEPTDWDGRILALNYLLGLLVSAANVSPATCRRG
ncbi:hypothetical protein Tco_1343508 [Tanacetum coccineum]